MSKTIVIKLTEGVEGLGPFTLSDTSGNIIAKDVSMKDLIAGMSFTVDDSLTMLVIESTGKCKFKKVKDITTVTQDEYKNAEFQLVYQVCMWRHLTDVVHYNFYYNNIEPYIIEYPFSYQYQDEILQNVQDYTKVYEYTKDPTGHFTECLKVQPDNKWFNKAVLWNAQQSSGLLVLEPKPVNNLSAYNAYPKYKTDSKVITYTKRDNFYNYNTFWNVLKNPQDFIFQPSCESLSIDKVLNQANMDYSNRAFKKAPLRAKDLRIRHILDNSSTTHLVSQFIVAPAQNSYL
jgi:hypothetical protein